MLCAVLLLLPGYNSHQGGFLDVRVYKEQYECDHYTNSRQVIAFTQDAMLEASKQFQTEAHVSQRHPQGSREVTCTRSSDKISLVLSWEGGGGGGTGLGIGGSPILALSRSSVLV